MNGLFTCNNESCLKIANTFDSVHKVAGSVSTYPNLTKFHSSYLSLQEVYGEGKGEVRTHIFVIQ